FPDAAMRRRHRRAILRDGWRCAAAGALSCRGERGVVIEKSDSRTQWPVDLAAWPKRLLPKWWIVEFWTTGLHGQPIVNRYGYHLTQEEAYQYIARVWGRRRPRRRQEPPPSTG